jgi:hypothetical protein
VLKAQPVDLAALDHQVQQVPGQLAVTGRLVRLVPVRHEHLVRLDAVGLLDLDDHVQQQRFVEQHGRPEWTDRAHRPVLACEPALRGQPLRQLRQQLLDQCVGFGHVAHLDSPSSPTVASWNQ